MKKPKTYDSYKRDEKSHKYDMTYEAHESCKNYEKYLLEKSKNLDYEFLEDVIKIEKVNGIVVSVISNISLRDFNILVKFLNEKK